jgi:hypothetical protein
MALTTIIPQLPNAPAVKPQSVSHISNGITTDINGTTFPLQTGVPVQNIYTFKVIPASVENEAVCQFKNFGDTGAGGSLTLNTFVVGSGNDIISRPIVFLGQPAVLLDCERILVLYFSKATLGACIATVTGYDYRGVAIYITSGNIPTGTNNVNIYAGFSVVTSVSLSANPFPSGDGSVSVGTNSQISLPYLLTNTSYVINSSWAGSDQATIEAGYNWRVIPELSLTSTARGFVDCNNVACDGNKELIVTYYVYGSDSELNAEIMNLNQSSLKIVGVQKTESSDYPNPVYVYPYLLDQDLTGLQLNNSSPSNVSGGGDLPFFKQYVTTCFS